MTRDQFNDIIEDIQHFHEPGTPEEVLYFFTMDNTRYEACWRWLNGGSTGVIVLDLVGDWPPFYLPVQSITYISVRKK